MPADPASLDLAHSFGAGGPDVEGLILALGFGVAAVITFLQKNVKPALSAVLLVVAVGVAVGSFTLGGSGSDASLAAPSDVRLEIISPQDGETVAAGEPVGMDIELSNASLTTSTDPSDPRQGHLHVFVDGQLLSMPMSLDDLEVTLEPGQHEVMVEYTSADHRSFSPRILDQVSVRAE